MLQLDIRSKRIQAGITGAVLCKKVVMHRSRLSDIERGHVAASADELSQLDTALNELIEAKKRVCLAAQEAGWPLEIFA